MSDLTRQRIDISQFDDDIFMITMEANGDISGQTFAFLVCDRLGNLIFNKTGQITDFGSPTTPGVIEVDFTGLHDWVDQDLNPLPVSTFVWEFRRTNPANEQLLAFGDFTIRRSMATS